jgi:hypothetical protein
MAGGHEVVEVGKQFYPLILRRRFRDALKAVPKHQQEAFIQHFAKWRHDNVPSPDQVIDENYIAQKYSSVPMEPPKPLGLKALITFPKNPIRHRNESMIYLEKVMQQNYAWLEDHKFPYEETKYFKYGYRPMVGIMYFLFFFVPFFFCTFVLSKTKFYKTFFEGGIFDRRRSPYQKKPWENLVQNENGEWVEK